MADTKTEKEKVKEITDKLEESTGGSRKSLIFFPNNTKFCF